MKINRQKTNTPTKGSPGYFTGNVSIAMPFQQTEPARVSGAIVTFEPGARTAWHTHPLGQTQIVVSGTGWIQCWGSPKKEITAGDVISCDCNEKHWHGATATSSMSHVAVSESVNGKVVEWLEQVSEKEYLGEIVND
jgi:quercetin dioxygenase-like cupin family protein